VGQGFKVSPNWQSHKKNQEPRVLPVQCVRQEARGRTILDLGSGVFARELLNPIPAKYLFCIFVHASDSKSLRSRLTDRRVISRGDPTSPFDEPAE